MTQQRHTPAASPETPDQPAGNDETYTRHGPEPPENDSGPSPSIEEMDRYSDFSIRNADPDEDTG